MHHAALTVSALAGLGLFSSVLSRWLRGWIIRREIKRLKSDLAELKNSVSHAEQMKTVITRWTLKNK